MAKRKEHQKALELRKDGKSYNQIRKTLSVSKSTLSLWLRDLPLSRKRIRELRDWNQVRIENYRETRRKNREEKLRVIQEEEKRIILPFSSRDVFIAGLFLYWGEGGKTSLGEITLSNTNPAVIKAFLAWAVQVLRVDRNHIYIRLHLYSDMDPEKEMGIWSKLLNIPRSQFRKPYIKASKFTSLTYRPGFGHGTCNIGTGSAIVAKKVMMGLKVIEEYFSG